MAIKNLYQCDECETIFPDHVFAINHQQSLAGKTKPFAYSVGDVLYMTDTMPNKIDDPLISVQARYRDIEHNNFYTVKFRHQYSIFPEGVETSPVSEFRLKKRIAEAVKSAS